MVDLSSEELLALFTMTAISAAAEKDEAIPNSNEPAKRVGRFRLHSLCIIKSPMLVLTIVGQVMYNMGNYRCEVEN